MLFGNGGDMGGIAKMLGIDMEKIDKVASGIGTRLDDYDAKLDEIYRMVSSLHEAAFADKQQSQEGNENE